MGGAFLLLPLVRSVAAFALALVLWGTAASVYHPAALALISTSVERRGRGLAYHGIAGNVGTALGPLAVILLLAEHDWSTAVVALSGVAGVAGLFAVASNVNEDRTADADATPAAATDGGLTSLSAFATASWRLFAGGFALVFVVVVFEGIYYRGVLTFLPGIFELVLPPTPIGADGSPARYAYAALLLIGTVGQYLGGRLSDRVAPARGLAAVFGALAITALLFEPLASLGTVGVAALALLFGVLLFGEQPLMQATVAEASPPETRGLIYGYTYLGAFGIGSAGAALTRTFFAVSSRAALFVVLAAVAAAAAVGLAVHRRRS